MLMISKLNENLVLTREDKIVSREVSFFTQAVNTWFIFPQAAQLGIHFWVIL